VVPSRSSSPPDWWFMSSDDPRLDVRRTTNPALRLPPEAIAEADAAVVESHIAQIATLAQILLGAAHSDGFYAATEAVAIATILARFVDLDPLPDQVREAMSAFDAATFDLEAACRRLTIETRRDRRELLELVSRVMDADLVLDSREAAYMRRLGQAIGASDEEVAALVADAEPPPVPGTVQGIPRPGFYRRFDESSSD